MKKMISMFFLLSLSILTSFDVPKNIERANGVDMPLDSFAFINIMNIRIEDICAENECKPLPSFSTASGVVVERTKTHTRILTAGHACAVIELGPTTIVVKDSNDKAHDVIAQVYSMDPDLCLLQTKDSWGSPLRVAKRNISRGDRSWNMAAPYGIFTAGMILIFEGIYSGVDSERRAWYTIPAAPGSSGSPILNKQGEIVGIIHSAFSKLENIALSTTQDEIRSFLKKSSGILDDQNLDDQKE
jgi:S1-C subfamily serine protease